MVAFEEQTSRLDRLVVVDGDAEDRWTSTRRPLQSLLAGVQEIRRARDELRAAVDKIREMVNGLT